MFLNSKDQISTPLKQPLGEVVFEIIGSSSKSGSDRLHSQAHPHSGHSNPSLH
jgi:hypothetical protein